MLRISITLLFALFQLTTLAQEGTDVESEVLEFSAVEQIPVPAGCEEVERADMEALKECFQKSLFNLVAYNYNYPETARKLEVQGKIYLGFVIEKDGSISNMKVIRGISEQYDESSPEKLAAAQALEEEAKRVIQSFKIVEPAIQRGKPVRMSFTMPFNLNIQ